MNRKPKVSKENLQTAKRLLKYVTGTYKVRFVIVFICILLSSIASISVSLSLKFLIDDFISPLIGQKIRILQNYIGHLRCLEAFS